MQTEETGIKDLIVFTAPKFGDHRGYFTESYNKSKLLEIGIDAEFIQDNQAGSTKGVLRGLHYQLNPFAQAKLVRVLEGEVQDVVVDIRKDSPTYGKSFSIVLSADNMKQMFVPRGFAHGYLVLSDTATFFYKVDNVYSKEHEGGIHYADPSLDIEWLLDSKEFKISEKDAILPGIEDALNNFS